MLLFSVILFFLFGDCLFEEGKHLWLFLAALGLFFVLEAQLVVDVVVAPDEYFTVR